MTAHDVKLAADFETGTREQWLALVDKAIKGADFEKRLVSRTEDGARIEPIYTRSDALPGSERMLPGHPPFTRGTEASPRGLGWDIRQFHSSSDAETVSRAVVEDLEGGANSVALHVASPGGSGLVLSAGALETALRGALLDYCSVALVAGETAAAAGEQLLALYDARAIKPEARSAFLNVDPIGTLAAMGALTTPINEQVSGAASLITKTKSMPGVRVLLADGVHYHNSGATEAQELGVMLATLAAYLRALEANGISPQEALPKIAVSLAVDTDQFLGLAKIRAARRLLWRVAEACGAGEAARTLHVTAVTSWRMLAKRDPWTNILRTTIATAGAALGGADAILVLPFTYVLGQTDSFARRVARNIQIVLQEESNLGRVVDPAGGSWYIERLTDELAHKAWTVFQDIEAKGGIVAVLTSGYLQDAIETSASARAKAVATGRIEVTGVSAFPLLGDDGVIVEPWAPGAGASGTPAVSIRALKASRLAAPFEALRDRADAYSAKAGKPQEVFLASIGEVIDHTTRSTWIKNYLAAGGIGSLTSDGYKDAEEAAAAFKSSGAVAACISSSDALYAEHAEATARALKAAGATLVLMAGRPGEREAALKDAGVDQFLYAGADAVATLSGLQAKLGISA